MPRKKPERKLKLPKNTDDPEQSRRFVETARELEVDESGKAFEKAIRGLIERPPKETRD